MSSRKFHDRTYEEIPIIVVVPPPMDPHETSVKIEEKDEEPSEAPERRLSLRRNSISLPNLDDLQVLKQHVQVGFSFSSFARTVNNENMN